MSNIEDDYALAFVEKVVYKAQDALLKTTYFQPFLMLRTDTGQIEEYENAVEESTQSYSLLEEMAKKRVKKGDVDMMVLVVDTLIPRQFVEDITNGIRVHLEEKSQKDNVIGARFLYIPYRLCQNLEGEKFVNLDAPMAVGFPAEYIV